MTSPPPEPRAAGALIALGAMLGAGIGLALHQPSAGFLIGLGIGVAIAVAMWLRDRGRERD